MLQLMAECDNKVFLLFPTTFLLSCMNEVFLGKINKYDSFIQGFNGLGFWSMFMGNNMYPLSEVIPRNMENRVGLNDQSHRRNIR